MDECKPLGAGRVTLAEGGEGETTQSGGRAFAAALAAAPSAWGSHSTTACGGDMAAVLQAVVPAGAYTAPLLSSS